MREEETVPPKVSKEDLREHFKISYNLTEEQIDVMLDSSSRSLHKSLSALYDLFTGETDLVEVSRIGHSLKGLLLNMGQEEWAELAREIERSAAAGEERDYQGMADLLHKGVEDILLIREE